MPKLFIHFINSEFRSRDEGTEYGDAKDAMRGAIRSAAAIATDEIDNGKASAAVEIRVEKPDGTPELRSVVCMSVAMLQIEARSR